jgi:hypothetical protein
MGFNEKPGFEPQVLGSIPRPPARSDGADGVGP